ncbi:pentatricopeptide repeat-containing protein At4g14850-like [Coffea eugenioides]|uniref:pentatricopeptide repeat-containing protein At4g14850-like n=1 Tax=Coffea eugenioides TaxID=49369 RepID=UPI000F605B38|nr:pentatricopeptide repeat-containing protein At4g14850-like [Coffea eugenioides]
MASLPSAVVGNTLKLDPDFKRHIPPSLTFDKKNYGNNAQLDKALDPFSMEFNEAIAIVKECSLKVESAAYLPLLQECIDKNSVSEAQVIHAHIIKTGTHQDWFLMTFLVNVYAKFGTVGNARKVFDSLPRRNVVSWTSLMSGYIKSSEPERAIGVFEEMLEAGVYPTNYTLGLVLNACSSLSDIELGKQIHGFILKYRIADDTSIGNALCSLYSKNGILDSAVKVFQSIEEKNVISWTGVISACGDNGNPAKGLDFFVEMLLEGAEPNEFTLTSVLSLCCVIQALEVGMQVQSLSIKHGYGSNLRVMNAVMYLYLKNGCISEANQLFDAMDIVSLVSWNAMIAGHAQMIDRAEDGVSAHQSGIQALKMLLRLHRSGLKPDLFTFSSVLDVCSSLAAPEQGEQAHAQTIKSGFLSDVVVGTALVDMYGKCGSIQGASKAFLEMSTRTMISWTAMITAFARHGQSRQALQLFGDMRFVGVKPNKITFVGVLAACSHAGMVDEGLAYFNMMKNECKIKPVMDHYGCLIDMFVRLGRLEEAFDLIKKMDFEPNEVIWSMLIAGCRSHGKLDLAFQAAEQLLNLNPKDSETYLSLLNLYFVAERWKDVSRVRKMMKAGKIGKLKDWSWMSIKDKVYSFKPDDQQGLMKEVEEYLADLHESVKTLGYEFQANFEAINSEEQETTSSTVHHSEKMAVAFGLLNTPNAAPIRIKKSISMCKDCHNFVKYISMSTSRTIIIRDSKKLHKFVNGHCSCGDFSSLL